MLDNIPHIKAFWIATGVDVAQTALWFGVDDLDGTVQEEKIYHMAGSPTPEGLTMTQLTNARPGRRARTARARHVLQRQRHHFRLKSADLSAAGSRRYNFCRSKFRRADSPSAGFGLFHVQTLRKVSQRPVEP